MTPINWENRHTNQNLKTKEETLLAIETVIAKELCRCLLCDAPIPAQSQCLKIDTPTHYGFICVRYTCLSHGVVCDAYERLGHHNRSTNCQ